MDKVESGQAVVEYVLLLAMVVSLYGMILGKLSETNALQKMKAPFEKEYKYTYEYGHPEARGQEDGGPLYIPQHHDQTNFRIFINPPISP